jgi:Fe-S oxidoreductase
MARAHRRTKAPWRWFSHPKISREELDEWEELLFDSCTMCGRCTQVCPMGIDIASLVAASRQAFAAAGMGLRICCRQRFGTRAARWAWLEVLPAGWLAMTTVEFPLDKKGGKCC